MIEAIVNTIRAEIVRARPRLARAIGHTVNAVGRLAKNRRGSWVQVAASYVVRGAGVGARLANEALRVVARCLVCKRTGPGYLTTTPDAIAACVRYVDRYGAPQPEVHRDDWIDPSAEHAEIEIPPGRERGKTACPCGEHSNGDRDPSLAYDLITGLATCQKTGAVYRRHGLGWVQVRAPYAERRTAGVAPSTRSLEGEDNAYPRGASRGPWAPRSAVGFHLTATLHGCGRTSRLTRSESVDVDGRPRSLASILRWADRVYGGPVEAERALTCAALGAERPGRLVSLERHVLDFDASTWRVAVSTGRWYPARRVWRSTGTDLVVLDLDDLDARDTEPRRSEVDALLAVLRERGAEPVAVVNTSETGCQIVVRGPGWAVDTQALYRDLSTRRWLQGLGEAALRALGRGGHVDTACWAPGRYVRRPGWRVKGGRAVRARLAWDEERGHADP